MIILAIVGGLALFLVAFFSVEYETTSSTVNSLGGLPSRFKLADIFTKKDKDTFIKVKLVV